MQVYEQHLFVFHLFLQDGGKVVLVLGNSFSANVKSLEEELMNNGLEVRYLPFSGNYLKNTSTPNTKQVHFETKADNIGSNFGYSG